MGIEFLKSKEKRDIIEKVNEIFGISKINYILIGTGREKIRGFSGSMSREQIERLSEKVRVEIIGGYLFKEEKNDEIRLSLDATHIFSQEIKKSVFEISEKELQAWIRGEDLEIKSDKIPGLYAVRCGKDFLGCGRWNGGKLFNYLPKERRIRKGQS